MAIVPGSADAVEAMYKELDEAESKQKKNTAKKAWKIAGNILFILIVAVLVFVLIWIQIAKEKGRTPVIFGISLYIVDTGSMEPTLPISSIIICKEPKSADELSVGDIITFTIPDGRRVVHRIYEKYEMNGEIVFKTKGDNNSGPDDWILTFDDIIAKMVMKLM